MAASTASIAAPTSAPTSPPVGVASTLPEVRTESYDPLGSDTGPDDTGSRTVGPDGLPCTYTDPGMIAVSPA